MIRSDTITNYLTLIRLPNIFTTIPNILVGYFLFTHIKDTNYIDLFLLISISILLYIGGIVLNDYVDLKKDKKERPSRPLPSNKIPKKNALYIYIISISSSVILSILTSVTGFLITVIIIALIFIYNLYSKERSLGPVNMGLIRSLNVLLGSSISFSLLDLQFTSLKVIIILFFEFLYVFVITFTSRNEVKKDSTENHFLLSFSIIYLIIFSILFLIFIDIFNFDSIINTIIFTVAIVYSHLYFYKNKISIQKLISLLIIFMVIYDSIFIVDSIGYLYGSTVLLLIPLIIFLGKKMYMT